MASSSPLRSRWPRHMAPKLAILALAAVAGLAAGLFSSPLVFYGASGPEIAQIPVAYAVTCGQNPGCGGGLVTSALDVDHRVYPGALTDDPVQLNNSEQVTVTAYSVNAFYSNDRLPVPVREQCIGRRCHYAQRHKLVSQLHGLQRHGRSDLWRDDVRRERR